MPSHLENFCRPWYTINVPRHQEPQKYDMVWELTTFNLAWCDETKSVVIHLPMVVMCFQIGDFIKILRIKG